MSATAAADSAVAPVRPTPSGRLNLCIVAHQAYGSLSRTGGHVGGVERQTALIARWLVQRGHRVSVIVWDEGQPRDHIIDGIRVITLCRQSDGVPIARFFHPRWSSLLGALKAADADVYYQGCAEYVTGQVGLWCRTNRRTFVYSAASDSDCDAALPLLTTWRERVLYRAGLHRADRIIVQTQRQREMLRANFGHDGTIMPMPGDDLLPVATGTRAGPPRIVWLGRICEVKRPDRLLDVAERCPALAFDLVGPPDGSAYAAAVMARAHTVPNVTVHGPLFDGRRDAVVAAASCLCSTSDIEGFPNTFLEAWSLGVPVLSTIDPDGVIARHGLGWIAADTATLVAQLLGPVSQPAERALAGNRARSYFLRTHAADAVLPRLETLLLDLSGGRR